MSDRPDPDIETLHDGDRLVGWLREAARELEDAHRALDELGAPRKIDPESECECTLATRIVLLAARRFLFPHVMKGELSDCPCVALASGQPEHKEPGA